MFVFKRIFYVPADVGQVATVAPRPAAPDAATAETPPPPTGNSQTIVRVAAESQTLQQLLKINPKAPWKGVEDNQVPRGYVAVFMADGSCSACLLVDSDEQH